MNLQKPSLKQVEKIEFGWYRWRDNSCRKVLYQLCIDRRLKKLFNFVSTQHQTLHMPLWIQSYMVPTDRQISSVHVRSESKVHIQADKDASVAVICPAPPPSPKNKQFLTYPGRRYCYDAEIHQFQRLIKCFNLSPGSQRILFAENAGGNSKISEALSFEILHQLFGATLAKTELEIDYGWHKWKKVEWNGN